MKGKYEANIFYLLHLKIASEEKLFLVKWFFSLTNSNLNFRTNYNLGLVHEAMGLYCSALHFLKKASDLKKNDPQVIGAMAGESTSFHPR